MHKTTIYLDPKEMRDLKLLAVRSGRGSAARLIREAVRDLLAHRTKTTAFKFLKRTLQKKPARTSFGDPLVYQRTLRGEWS